MTSFDDFGDLQSRMNDLTVTFDSYINRTRAEVITSKQDHYGRVTELKSRQGQLEMEIAALQQKEKKIKDTIARTLEELQLQHLKVNELQLKETTQLHERDQLQRQVEAQLQLVRQAEEAVRNQKQDLQAQVLRDHPELAKFEHFLGLRIEAVREDCVRFVFYNVFWDNVDKEVDCQINVGDAKYVLERTNPELLPETAQRIEGQLNETKNFSKFLKNIRLELRDAAEKEETVVKEAEAAAKEEAEKEQKVDDDILVSEKNNEESPDKDMDMELEETVAVEANVPAKDTELEVAAEVQSAVANEDEREPMEITVQQEIIEDVERPEDAADSTDAANAAIEEGASSSSEN